ncbi:MAG: CysZ protein [Pseudomonadota bacterium]|nr:CysZ protein [Pseudomonadota bacterium]MDQ5942571.1 CysZ protein [Pseudomonadota bacterium]
MIEVFNALVRSLNNLQDRSIWLRLIGPAVVALVVWLALAFFALEWFVAELLQWPPLTWIAAWGVVWLAKILAWIGGWLAVFSLAYLTAMLLAAIFIVPLLVNEIGAREYPDVARMGEDSVVASTGNSLIAATGFLIGWIGTLPLWLIPGMALVLPIYWLAWLNRRTFAYDALAAHATRSEWKTLFEKHRGNMLLLGVLLGLLAHVPFVGLLVPAFAALAYVHYGLEALRRERDGAVVVIEGEAKRI